MKPEKRKELLLWEAEHPESYYVNQNGREVMMPFVLLNYTDDWEIYHEPKPDQVAELEADKAELLKVISTARFHSYNENTKEAFNVCNEAIAKYEVKS